jgi:hypothetical protein
MDPFNALSITAAARNIPPLKEAPPTKVMLCALVTSTDLEKTLDAVKKVTEELARHWQRWSAGQLPWPAGHGL